MRTPSLILFASLLALWPAQAPADGLPKDAQSALKEALHGRGAELDKDGLQAAAQAAWDAGASKRELLALVQEAPATAAPAELAQALTELKDLLGEGLLGREARKAASRSLEARVRARLDKAEAPQSAFKDKPKGLKSREAAREAAEERGRERRDEMRDRGGRRAPDGGLAQPTPAPH